METIYQTTAIDPWFLFQLEQIFRMEQDLREAYPGPLFYGKDAFAGLAVLLAGLGIHGLLSLAGLLPGMFSSPLHLEGGNVVSNRRHVFVGDNVIDENVDIPDYSNLPRPDLVGVTAFTSQAPRAYEIAAMFRDRGIPVVMGGIHASMCPEEALAHADAIVTGEAESEQHREDVYCEYYNAMPWHTEPTAQMTMVPCFS